MKKATLGLAIAMLALFSVSTTMAAPIGGHCINNTEARSNAWLAFLQYLQTRVFNQC
jgi:hypothetical protein